MNLDSILKRAASITQTASKLAEIFSGELTKIIEKKEAPEPKRAMFKMTSRGLGVVSLATHLTGSQHYLLLGKVKAPEGETWFEQLPDDFKVVSQEGKQVFAKAGKAFYVSVNTYVRALDVDQRSCVIIYQGAKR